ncbi:MAG TPA: glycosyltransferase family 87 protein [Candidatus Limnocylindrales bacterium]
MRSQAARRSVPRARFAWAVLGVTAWLALAALIGLMYVQRNPPSAGFDLELLLEGARRAAAGLTPYDPGLIAGQPVEIQSLFYSYPPLVAQAMTLVSWLPSPIVLAAWDVGAVIAAIAVAGLIERRMTGQPATFRLQVFALLPLWFPFAIALMFGNLDAWFAAAFGLVLVAVMNDADDDEAGLASARRDIVVAGVALALVSITKLHPASLGLWFLVRGARARFTAGRRRDLPASWRILAVAAIVGGAALATSIVVGGVGPWRDYLAVLRAGVNVDLLDARNLGPSVQVALAAGLGPEAVRTLQVAVTGLAIVATAAVAWRLRDPVESLAWATVASFVVLPVTWFHYPSALIPFAVVAVVRSMAAGAAARRRTVTFLGAALALGILGLGLPIMWLSVLALLLGVRASRGPLGPSVAPAPGPLPVGA